MVVRFVLFFVAFLCFLFAVAWVASGFDSDPCRIDAPMERAQCRAANPPGPEAKMFLTYSRRRGIMFPRGVWPRKGG